MEGLGTSAHAEPAGQDALGVHAGLDAGPHRGAQPVQVGDDLLAAAGGELVGQDDVGDAQALALADRQHRGRRGEGEGCGGGVRLGGGGGRQGLDRRRPGGADVLHDEAAAHGVVGTAQNLGAAGAVGGQGHAVDVVGQDPPGQEVDVGARAEGDGADAVDHQLAGGLDLLHEGLAHDGGDRLGLVAGQAHDGGAVGGVPAAGGAQRAVELDGDAAGLRQAGAGGRGGALAVGGPRAAWADRLGQGPAEGAAGPHGAHGVGGGGADADAHEVEDAQRAGRLLDVDGPGQEGGGRGRVQCRGDERGLPGDVGWLSDRRGRRSGCGIGGV